MLKNSLMAELKAFEKIQGIHKNQAINYPDIYNIADGLLTNFRASSLEFKRVYNKKLVKPGGESD